VRLGSSRDNKEESVKGDHNLTNKVEISERTLSVLAFGFSIAAFVYAWSLSREVDRLVREVHVNTVTVENHDALMLRYGIKQPEDVMRGPNGNLQYQPKEK
jgi:hypothetical protein